MARMPRSCRVTGRLCKGAYGIGECSRNSLDPYYLVPHYYLGHIPSLFGSRWVVGYQVVGVLRVPRRVGKEVRASVGLGVLVL